MHGRERHEKNCLNCGAEVVGQYCHHCGQANVHMEDSVLGIMSHFVADIFHYDGKFFSTLRLLLLRPAFLTKEYLRGRRNAYLHPVKMYVFTSAISFLIFFFLKDHPPSSFKKEHAALAKKEQKVVNAGGAANSWQQDGNWKVNLSNNLAANYTTLYDSLQKVTGESAQANLREELAAVEVSIISLEKSAGIPRVTVFPDSLRQIRESEMEKAGINLPAFPGNFGTYDSTQNSLPPEKRDGMLKRFMLGKIYRFGDEVNQAGDHFWKDFFDDFLHKMPQMMFVSLPFITLFIYLLYFRHHRRNYVGHGILTIHNYIAMYILLVLGLLLSYTYLFLPLWLVLMLLSALALYALWYNFKSLRNFFHQSTGKTLFKYFILLMLSMVLFTLLGMIFISWTALSSV